MPEDQEPSGDGGGGGGDSLSKMLTKKYMGAPLWVWGLVVGLAVGGIWWWKSRQSATGTSAGTSTSTASTAGTATSTTPADAGYTPAYGSSPTGGNGTWSPFSPGGDNGNLGALPPPAATTPSPVGITTPPPAAQEGSPVGSLVGSGYLPAAGDVGGTAVTDAQGSTYNLLTNPAQQSAILASGGSTYYEPTPGVFLQVPANDAGLAPGTPQYQKVG